jgi:hypothetical protein
LHKLLYLQQKQDKSMDPPVIQGNDDISRSLREDASRIKQLSKSFQAEEAARVLRENQEELKQINAARLLWLSQFSARF